MAALILGSIWALLFLPLIMWGMVLNGIDPLKWLRYRHNYNAALEVKASFRQRKDL